MRKPNTDTDFTTAVFFTIDKDKLLNSCEITFKGKFSEEQVEEFLKSQYTGNSSDKFYLLLDVA